MVDHVIYQNLCFSHCESTSIVFRNSWKNEMDVHGIVVDVVIWTGDCRQIPFTFHRILEVSLIVRLDGHIMKLVT